MCFRYYRINLIQLPISLVVCVRIIKSVRSRMFGTRSSIYLLLLSCLKLLKSSFSSGIQSSLLKISIWSKFEKPHKSNCYADGHVFKRMHGVPYELEIGIACCLMLFGWLLIWFAKKLSFYNSSVHGKKTLKLPVRAFACPDPMVWPNFP